MELSKTPVTIRALGITSLILGVLGGVFCWWTPTGMVMSLAGLLMGFVGLTFARGRSVNSSLAMGGMLLAAATLLLDCIVAGLGLELVKFQSLR